MSRCADWFTALLDACVLGGALRRNMLLSLAEAGLFRPRWSSRILDETQKAITQITKGETDGSRQRAAIEAAFPEALVTGYEIFEGKLALPDPGDGQKLSRTFETAFGIARGQIACGAQYALHCSRLTYCDAGQELSKLVLVLNRPSGARPTIFLPYWG